jgi:uncharacterized iron-regulated protein
LSYIDLKNYKKGSEEHYNVFESMISGRVLAVSQTPTDRFRKIFPAQIIKDAAMANKIVKTLNEGNKDDKILVLMGKGHCEYGFGVPERVFEVCDKNNLE